MITSQSTVDLAQNRFGLNDLSRDARNPLERRQLFQAQAQVDGMANDLLDKMPAWLKSVCGTWKMS